MAELIIQNPSITTDAFEYDEAGRVSAIAEHPLAGGGGGTIEKSDLMWKPTVGSDGYVRWSLASSATTPADAYISGAQGPAGPQGVSGNPGKNPEFQINSENAHWEWRYSGDASWTDLGIVASGAVGPQGLSGNDGKDGISPKVRINNSTNFWEISEDDGKTWTSTNVSATGPAGEDGTNGTNGVSPTVSTSAIPGGNRVIFTYDNGGTTATESIDVMSGASGANGSDGFSPTVVTAAIPVSEQFPAGGTEVTITDSDGQHIFNISNGLDGQGATVNLLGGEGIEVTKVASNYTISVSADYATKAYVEAASANAYNEAETWVRNQGYLTSVPPEYALTSDIPTAVAQLTDSGNYYKKAETSGATEITNALSTKLDSTAAAQTYQTKSDMANYLTTSDASTTYQPKGNYASASDIVGMATQTWVGQQGFITKDTNDLTYYYKKTETSGASELSTEFAKYVTKPDSSLVNNYLVLRTDNAGNVSGWCDFNDQCYSKSEADGRYQKKADMSSYLTTAQYETDSAKYVLTGDILTAANNKLTGIKIGSTDYTVPTTDLSNYYTKSETSATGELNTEFAKKLDSSIAASTYQTKDDMSAYVAVTGDQMTGQLELSGSNYDDYYLKVVRQNVNGHARFGLGGGGGAVIKSVDGTNNAQMLVKSNATSGIEILLQKNSNEYIGNLIPMIVEAAGWTPTGNDYKLHIVLDS